MPKTRLPKKRQQRANPLWIVGLVVVAVALVAIIAYANRPIPATTAEALGFCGQAECGQANAPVTIEIYSDFQCPFCAQADSILQQLAAPYVQTGKARLVYRIVAFIGQESVVAAQAALCAGDQNKFWAYAGYLFSHQGAENSGAFSQARLVDFAAKLRLDTTAFNACLSSGKYATAVQQGTSLATQRGVTATPTFFINGQRYEGVLSYSQLAALIDAAQPR